MLLFDGAFGTYYFSLTGDSAPCELANLNAPERVRQIHTEYLQAGVSALKTNTFAANPAVIPDGATLRAVLESGLQLAQQAANGKARVFADIGGIESEQPAADYQAVAQLFLELGARDFLFETLSSLDGLEQALQTIKQAVPDGMVIVSFAVSQDGYTRRGLPYRALLDRAARHPLIDAVGLNCVCGPSHMQQLLRGLGRLEKPLCAMPNAGYPSALNGRVLFEDNVDYFAEKLAALYASGAEILGGCCGSTPRHLAAAANALQQAQPLPAATMAPSGSTAQAGWLEQAFAAPNHKLIAVELDPPLDSDCGYVVSAAAAVQKAGADWVTVADSPLSRVRADSIMTAAKIRREVGIDVMPHLCCRDKNHIALKAGLLGAAFEGIDRVLIITGDPPQQSDLRRGAGVFSFNSFDLMRFLSGLNEDVFRARPFAIAGALNVNAANFSAELTRAKKKLDCGASMLFTQPIFSQAAVSNFLLARQQLDCKLFAGILPVAGYKNAVFLLNEVSGIEIPASVIEALRDKTPEQAAEISVAYSAGIVDQVYAAADGFYLMTPLRKTNIIRGLIEKIRRKEA